MVIILEASKYNIVRTKSFLNDITNLPVSFQLSYLDKAISLLKEGKTLNHEYDFHILKGRRAGKCCIHIPDPNAYTEDNAGELNTYSDWQLFYDLDDKKKIIVLEETGTHEYLRQKNKTSGKKR